MFHVFFLAAFIGTGKEPSTCTQGAKLSTTDAAATIFFTVCFGAATVRAATVRTATIRGQRLFHPAVQCRRRGYYFFFAVCFGVATIRGQVLFKGGIYFFEKSKDIDDGLIRYI